MNFFTGKTRCIHCGHESSGTEIFTGCPVCRERGIASSFETVYSFDDYTKEELHDIYYNAPKAPGIWKHREFFPIPEDVEPISIGEGNTPLVHLKRLGKKLGLKNLYIKNESQNPTWSHKDRLAAVGVTRAKYEGATAVVASSTGNHGAATAAMSAAAGIPCVVFSVAKVPQTMKAQIQSVGASVIIMPTMEDRWILQKQCVEENGWYPLTGYVKPSVGSNPFGVDGYKSIAFELFDEMGTLPDFMVVPCAHSDAMYGIWKGIQDLVNIGVAEKPSRMVAAEVYGSFRESLIQGTEDTVTVPTDDWTVSFSIGEAKGTLQGYTAIKQSNGLAHFSHDEETLAMQKALACTEGIFAEASSVTSLVVIKKLLDEGHIDPDATVVALITSSGIKDPETAATQLPPAPQIEVSKDALKDALETYYDLHLL